MPAQGAAHYDKKTKGERMAQMQPIFILPEGATRTIGRDAQRNNIAAAKLVAETVRTTLGPKGMDKMIVDSLGDITVTNDGVTILEEMQIEHPAAKMIVEVAKTQEAEVRDVKRVIDEEHGVLKFDKEHIKLEKKVGGSVEDSELIEGVVLEKEAVHPAMPKHVHDAKIALIDCPLEIKDTEIDAKISITDPSQMQAFIDQEEKMLRTMVDKVAASGANVVFCQKGIDDLAQHFLAKKGIYAARRVKKSDLEALS